MTVIRRRHKAQNILEFAVLFSVVLAALFIMQFYIKRAYQGRLKEHADGLGQQYSPEHTTSRTQTTTQVDSTSWYPSAGVSATRATTSTSFDHRETVDSFM